MNLPPNFLFMPEKNKLIDLSFIGLSADELEGSPESDPRQFDRFAISYTMAELLEDVFGENTVCEEPHLDDPKDEKSDLIAKLDFGEELKAVMRIPYIGRLHIDNQKIFAKTQEIRDKLKTTLGNLVENIEGVVIERCGFPESA